jgi:hypothetical protein
MVLTVQNHVLAMRMCLGALVAGASCMSVM